MWSIKNKRNVLNKCNGLERGIIMGWIILGILIIIASIFCLVIGFDGSGDGWVGIGTVFLIVGIVMTALSGIEQATHRAEQGDFIEAKYLIENYPTSEQAKDIDVVYLNVWLMKATYNRVTYKGWSFFHESVLELSPIPETVAPVIPEITVVPVT